MTMPFLGTSQIGSFPAAGIRPLQKKNRIFTTSGVWVAPNNVYTLDLIMCGGGGGGSAGTTVPNASVGSGGGGAATVIGKSIPVIPGTSYTITVGANGIGGTSQGGNGTSGGTTSILGGIISLTAPGGSAGTSTGGNGGSLANITGQLLLEATSSALGINLSYVAGASGGIGANTPANGSPVVLSRGGTFGLTDGGGAIGGGGGGASLISPGGLGGNGLSNGRSPTSGYGGGGGGGGGGDGVSIFYTGGNGASGVVLLTWEE